MGDSNRLTLVASDGGKFVVDKEVVQMSVLLKNMIEDLGETDESIPIPNVTSPVLTKVIEFCENHRTDAARTDGPNVDGDDARMRTAVVSDWDRQFFDVDQDLMFEIIVAANYLDIKSLVDVGCKVVADMIKGKSPQEIRDLFDIVNDFSPEEEAALRKENEWANDR
ncbi:putative negative regulator sulfur controller-3 [Lentinus brumalis]|uniref:E3 ubiquitin ligase complex SCF subunit n=1 Tax=Lentinus brumalis TaxID=2498619 RepID=A0A371DM72_9APHY|nr:putative negative regulator sulfur controller-3 [Polyporus brumalis]